MQQKVNSFLGPDYTYTSEFLSEFTFFCYKIKKLDLQMYNFQEFIIN